MRIVSEQLSSSGGKSRRKSNLPAGVRQSKISEVRGDIWPFQSGERK
jgi:hypothetical protein